MASGLQFLKIYRDLKQDTLSSSMELDIVSKSMTALINSTMQNLTSHLEEYSFNGVEFATWSIMFSDLVTSSKKCKDRIFGSLHLI